MDDLNYWRLCDHLNVVQAALLIVGADPSIAQLTERGIEFNSQVRGYDAASTAIIHALEKYGEYLDAIGLGTSNNHSSQALKAPDAERLKSLKQGALKGKIVPVWATDTNGNRHSIMEGVIDLWQSTVEVAALKVWLKERGFTTGFFFPDLEDKPDYLDPHNPRYAPKLAAAVHAWQAVTDPGTKSPKRALDKWLREHAAEFGLTDDEGQPVNQAVEDCSKVANWQPSGGAPKTPG
jgi:hypothetical protein